MPQVKSKGKNFAIHVTGINVVLRNLERTKNQEDAIKDFLEIEAEDIIDRAQEIVPYDTGRLHDSHRKGAVKTGDRPSIDVMAGGIVVRGKMVNYAKKVHDNDPWLQEACDMQMRGFTSRLAKTIKIYGGK
jgi:hypothetical protein